jgi:hypothetical protein
LKKFDAIEYYIYAIFPLFIIGLGCLVALFFLNTSVLSQILSGALSILDNPLGLFMGQVAMGLERYIKCVGVLPLLFSIMGLYFSFKKRELLFVTFWALIAFLFSNLHWFGIPVYTFRLLIYLIIPMVILGGYGILNILNIFQNNNSKIVHIFVGAFIIITLILAFIHINDPSFNNFSSTTEQSTYQIAPPTSDEVELINFFKNETVGNKSILINNLFLGTVISSIDEIPIHYEFDVYTNKSLSKSSLSSLNKEQIGYIVYDKSLVMNNSSNDLDVRYVNGSYYPSYYFTDEITDSNFYKIKLDSSEKIFENNRFIVCKIN